MEDQVREKQTLKIKQLVNTLSISDSKKAYESFQILQQLSVDTDLVYPFLDIFAEMIADKNAYIRTRGLLLIAANAKWDKENKLDELADSYLSHIMDEKPITARQCIKALPQIVEYKPALKSDVVHALQRANPQRYPDSMVTLIQKDIQEVLLKIDNFL